MLVWQVTHDYEPVLVPIELINCAFDKVAFGIELYQSKQQHELDWSIKGKLFLQRWLWCSRSTMSLSCVSLSPSSQLNSPKCHHPVLPCSYWPLYAKGWSCLHLARPEGQLRTQSSPICLGASSVQCGSQSHWACLIALYYDYLSWINHLFWTWWGFSSFWVFSCCLHFCYHLIPINLEGNYGLTKMPSLFSCDLSFAMLELAMKFHWCDTRS